MTKPLSLDTILNELPDDDEMWVLQDRGSGMYLTIPDPKFPDRRPIRFFMKREDAQAVLNEVLDVSNRLRDAEIFPVKVPLKQAIRNIARDRNKENANSFVVHSPNEVHEFLWNGQNS